MNLTISVPDGSSNHGDSELICTPPDWYDYVLFIMTNYVAHVATVITLPGQSLTETISVALAALLVPSSGIMRAVEIFIRRPALKKGNQLNRAAAATALCMVVKLHKDALGKLKIDTSKYSWLQNVSLVRERASIHGQCSLPEGYALAYVPDTPSLHFRNRRTEEETEDPDEKTPNTAVQELGAVYNIPKAVISMAQAFWAVITLYRARGNQVEQYGYAAYGLTVAQYAYMSVVNLTATCLTPEYPAIYMVRTSLMKEAEEKKGWFVGEVGELDMDRITSVNDADDTNFAAWIIGFFLSLPPLAIVGAISRFHAGHSTSLQRGFTMAWLATGIFGGIWTYFWLWIAFDGEERMQRGLKTMKDSLERIFAISIIVLLPLAAPAIGGFVVVGLMLKEYGVCVSLH